MVLHFSDFITKVKEDLLDSLLQQGNRFLLTNINDQRKVR